MTASGGRGDLEMAVFHLKNQSGAVDRTAYLKLADWISVKDYGATGDGLNNDTDAINNAIIAAGATQLLNFPCPGTYIHDTYGTISCGVYYPPLAATGAVPRSVSDKLLDFINVRDFGAIGDSSHDDTTAIQNALNYAFNLSTDTGRQGRVYLGHGGYKITAPLHIGKSTDVLGEGANFGTTIKVASTFVGAAAIIIDGAEATGGFNFRQTIRDFIIDCTSTSKAILPITIKVKNSYNIAFEHVWIYNGYGTGWDIDYPQDVTLLGCRAWGVIANAGNSEYGIRIHNSGGTAGGASAMIINPDIEAYFKAISIEDDAVVTMINPYVERSIIGWQAINNSNGSLSVVGGRLNSPGASGTAAKIAGPNVSVLGGSYIANGGIGLQVDTTQRWANVRITNVVPVADILDNRNYAWKETTDTSHYYPSHARNYKTPADAAVTTFYTINVPFTQAYYGIVDMRVDARDNSGYSVWTANYRFAVTNADGTVRATAVTEYAKANANASGNYSLAITVVATVSGNSILVQITGDTGGALGNGVAPLISTDLNLTQWDQAGGVYLTVN